MQVNRSLPQPKPKKACIRDMAELMQVLKPAAEVLKAVPIKHVKRRLNEIVAERPHLAEEAPLVLRGELARRRRLAQSTQLLSIAR